MSGKAYKKDRVSYRRSDIWVGQRSESMMTEDRWNKAFGIVPHGDNKDSDPDKEE